MLKLTPLITLLLTTIASAQNLIHIGDLEDRSTQRPPPGRAMWGPDESKPPANDTRDLTNPHAGHASLKITHPKNSAGYIVTAPANMIHTQPGKTYDFNFYARANEKCRVSFGLGSYSKIDPFVDAPSPGAWNLELTTDWKPFHFTIRDGVDFDAAVSPMLMLTFKATTGWQMLTNENAPGFAVLVSDAPQKRSIVYWLYYHCTRTIGPRLLPITGTSPYHESVDTHTAGPVAPMLATASADGSTISLIAVNGSWTVPLPMTIALPGFSPSTATASVLLQPSLDSEPILLDAKDPLVPLAVQIGEKVITTLPPHSVVFLTIKR